MSLKQRFGAWMARKDQGISTLEVAILFPAIFVPIFFGIQVEMYHYSRQVAFAGAEKGMQLLAAMNPNGQPNQSQLDTVSNAISQYVSTAGGDWLTLNGPPVVTYTPDPVTLQPRYRITINATEASLGYQFTFGSTEVVEGPLELFTHG